MMYNVNPYSAYKDQDLETCSKYEIVGKLYAQAVVCVKRAELSIQNKRLDIANENIMKAEVILINLNEALDMRYGFTEQIRMLYDYMIKRLKQANSSKDTEILKEVHGILAELRDTWAEALKKFKMSQTCQTN